MLLLIMFDYSLENMDNEEVDDLNVSGCSTPKKRRMNRGGDLNKNEKAKHRAQKFCLKWKSDIDFKDWIEPDCSDEFKAKCRFCKVSMVAEKTVLKNHAKGKKHTLLLSNVGVKQKSMTAFTLENSMHKAVQQAEIKLAAYFTEHNIPFLAADHLSCLLKEIFPDSEIAKQLSIKRTKITAVIKNVIGATQKNELAQVLKNVKFSLLTDESTDIGTIKTSCFVARYNIILLFYNLTSRKFYFILGIMIKNRRKLRVRSGNFIMCLLLTTLLRQMQNPCTMG